MVDKKKEASRKKSLGSVQDIQMTFMKPKHKQLAALIQTLKTAASNVTTFLLNNFSGIFLLSFAAFFLSAVYASLKKFSLEKFLRLTALNMSPLFLGLISTMLIQWLNDCPQLFGECYTEGYREWRLFLFSFVVVFYLFNLGLIFLSLGLLMRKFLSLVSQRIGRLKLSPK